jgi:hypothetical protein
MAKLTINSQYYDIIDGTGDFKKAIASVDSTLSISITYDELSSCNTTPLHIAIVSGDVDVGVKYEVICQEEVEETTNNFRLIAFNSTSNITYNIKNKIISNSITFKSDWQTYTDDCQGQINVSDYQIDINRSGCGSNGGPTGIYKENLKIPIENANQIDVEVLINSYDLSDGGYHNTEYPANVYFIVEDDVGNTIPIYFSYTADQNDNVHTYNTAKFVVKKIDKGSWVSDSKKITDYIPNAKYITRIALLGQGWNYSSSIKNLKLNGNLINLKESTITIKKSSDQYERGAFATDIIYQKYKKVTETNFTKDKFQYCDIFICANNVPIDVKYNGQVIRTIDSKGIYYIPKQTLADNNILDAGNNKFLVVCYIDNFNVKRESDISLSVCDVTTDSNWFQNCIEGL